MVQSFIQPKGTLKPQTGIEDLQKQYAQLFVKPQAQEQQETDTLRQTVNDLVKSRLLNPVEVPKYTTLSDVLGAEKGSKLNAFADFLNNPQTMRTIGSFLPKYGYDPKTGQMNNVMETPARIQETKFEADRQKALEELKLQNGLMGDIYNAYQQMDIANMNDKRARELAENELKFRKEENALNRQLQRDHLNATIAHQRAMEGIARTRAAGGGAGGGARLTSSAAENLSGTYQGINQMTGLKSKIDKLPKRITTPGIAQLSAMNPLDTDAQTFNQYVKTYKQVIGKGLEGGVLRKEDEYKYDQIIPKLGDTKAVLKKKADQLQDMLVDKYKTDIDFYGMAGYNTGNFPGLDFYDDPIGLGL